MKKQIIINSWLETTLEDYNRRMHVIAFDEKMNVMLCKEFIKEFQVYKVHYIYEATEDMTMDFSLLCECTKWAADRFIDLIKDSKLIIASFDTPTDYYEIVNDFNISYIA